MKKVNIDNNVLMVAEKGFDKEKRRIITYYIVTPRYERMYAFVLGYRHSTFDLCKNGYRINDLVVLKTDNRAVMQLVQRTKRMMPYLAEYYDISKAV